MRRIPRHARRGATTATLWGQRSPTGKLVGRIVCETVAGESAPPEVADLEQQTPTPTPTKEPRDVGLFAVVESGGKQHRVVCGEVVRLERLPGEPGEAVSFARVLMIGAGQDVLVGAPYVQGGLVAGEVVAQGKGPKIRVIKFKRRKNYLRHKGHRQAFTDVRITRISRPVVQLAAEAPAAAEAPETADPQPTAEAA